MEEYISRDAAIQVCSDKQGRATTRGVLTGISQVWAGIKRIPAADVVPVVRCKDCANYSNKWKLCRVCANYVDPTHFCGYGTRKEATT